MEQEYVFAASKQLALPMAGCLRKTTDYDGWGVVSGNVVKGLCLGEVTIVFVQAARARTIV